MIALSGLHIKASWMRGFVKSLRKADELGWREVLKNRSKDLCV